MIRNKCIGKDDMPYSFISGSQQPEFGESGTNISNSSAFGPDPGRRLVILQHMMTVKHYLPPVKQLSVFTSQSLVKLVFYI